MNRRNFIKSASTLGLLAGAGIHAPAIAQQKPLKVGVLAGRSGALGAIGECGLRATEWAVDRINKQGGIAGRKVELAVEEETSPKDTSDRFKKLVLQSGVDCVQGVLSTGVMLSIGVVAEESKTVFLSWDGTTQSGVEETMPNAKYTFKSTDNEVEAMIAGIMAINRYKGQFKTMAGMNNDFSYGRNAWSAFQALLKKYKIDSQSVSEQWIKVGAIDLTSSVNAVKSAQPDLLYISVLFGEAPVLMKQAAAAGLFKQSKIVYPMGGFNQNQLKKEFTPEGFILGLNTLSFDYEGASSLQKEFVSYYMERFKEPPSSAAERAYFAMELYRRGVEKAVNALGGRWPTKEEVAANIEDLEVESLGGKARMKKNHIPEQLFYLGTTTHDNNYDFVTIKDVKVVSSEGFQKPQGGDFWKWIEDAQFSV
ncbi:ABC transporter substrate-binding protein [Bradyrhizobium ottawaense]|uniref:ABC transporter substrate-binding protein n=1 Tax=Bradyrhizobium ottawaense TaxID=931866 RepID=UPI000415ADA4|nr:ABC transporter substrate-binding protein [Bradyrhizobium ottawaense]